MREHAVRLGGAVTRVPSILHADDRNEGPRLIDLAHRHVREADVRDLALCAEARQLADALGQGDARIGRVKLVDVDAVDIERVETRLAGPSQMVWPGVARPGSLRALEPALGRNDDPGGLSFSKGTRDESLAVPDVAIVHAVHVRRIEKRDAGVDRGEQRTHRLVLAGPVADSRGTCTPSPRRSP